MEITLTPEQEAFIRTRIDSGRYKSTEDAVRAALEVWAEFERDRIELMALIDEGDAALESGDYTEYDDEGLKQLGERIKREGLERLAKSSAVLAS